VLCLELVEVQKCYFHVHKWATRVLDQEKLEEGNVKENVVSWGMRNLCNNEGKKIHLLFHILRGVTCFFFSYKIIKLFILIQSLGWFHNISKADWFVKCAKLGWAYIKGLPLNSTQWLI